ncbi:MAG: hypothetical protein JSV56_02395 [Methanomassiliicoccales archaeon]|nr:MAG: hypothetical protein JSV56_02395 [Methanomassiliicoccales archaeon]
MSLHSRISTSTTGRRISNKAIFALVFYLILPTFAILMIIFTYPELDRDRLFGILSRIIPISFVLIVISQFQVRYEKGSRGRFVLNELYVVTVVFWLFALLGGQPVIHQTWEEYQFSLYIWNYLALIFFVTGMNILYYVLEYRAYGNKEVVVEPLSEEEKPMDDEVKPKGVIITTVQG